MSQSDFLFRGNLSHLDPDVAELIRHETARQARYLILIPSESTIPEAVREALSSAFHNIYAEGYPLESTRTMTEAEILDYNARLTEYRRGADLRYYKGTEYANIVESLARRRAAELFATNGLSADALYVNVQPLSGAPANSAVYTALIKPGDVIMGMDLIMGGHLTHGSPVARSGKQYTVVSYGINHETGDIDYDQMMRLAMEHKPKILIGGYSSFPYQADWAKYRAVADACGAYLLADIAHVAGLVAAGVYPSPVGIADIVTFTTHKTLGGPRGAIVITHRKDLSAKLDRGVFPGEQGGPHMNSIAALAVALKLANTDQFRTLQAQTVSNASRFADRLTERGIKIAYGGTNTHLFNVDLRPIIGADGTTLSGDMAARILDLCGIVLNRQTIPGDTSALKPNGIRIGTPWITQRGFGFAEIDELADIIADVLLACIPYSYTGRKGEEARAKLPFDVLQDARTRVKNLAGRVGIDTDSVADDYPHFHTLAPLDKGENWGTLRIIGEKATAFLDIALSSAVSTLSDGQKQPTSLHTPSGHTLANGIIARVNATTYELHLERNAEYVAGWLRSLSDGFVLIDTQDPYARIPGPVDVLVMGSTIPQTLQPVQPAQKAFFIGMNKANAPEALPRFTWTDTEPDPLLVTTVHATHKALGAKMVGFAGYDMPVWYSSVTEEHLAVRNGAGIFDVTHMGAWDIKGKDAIAFLDAITTNDVPSLKVGTSHYTYFLDVDGVPLDDLMIYRLAEDEFLVVVNASNNDKNWAWVNAIRDGSVQIDPANPSRVLGLTDFVLRDLRAVSSGNDRRVDVALQGPKSKDMLIALGASDADIAKLNKLAWAGVMRGTFGEFNLIISRTGYTGERVAYELFVHPEQAPALFKALVDLGVTPCGLAARDSLRTEAGLPLYGHELGGDLSLSAGDAGFGSYVKIYKPFFVGRGGYIARETARTAEIVRFRVDAKGARPPHGGDPLVDKKGRVVGIVTSCSIDSDGYQLGQAYVKFEFMTEGTQLGIFAGAGKSKPLSLSDANLGSKITVPEPVTVLSRFPKKK
jgi:glycine hydroxymethyltransferase